MTGFGSRALNEHLEIKEIRDSGKTRRKVKVKEPPGAGMRRDKRRPQRFPTRAPRLGHHRATKTLIALSRRYFRNMVDYLLVTCLHRIV